MTDREVLLKSVYTDCGLGCSVVGCVKDTWVNCLNTEIGSSLWNCFDKKNRDQHYGYMKTQSVSSK